MLARARVADLTSRAVEGQFVVVDTTTGLEHRLEPVAASIWRHADGTRTTAELGRLAEAELGTGVDELTVWEVLDALADAGLLERRVTPPAGEGVSRRRFLHTAGAASVAVGAVTIGTAAPAFAAPTQQEQQQKQQQEQRQKEQQGKRVQCPVLTQTITGQYQGPVDVGAGQVVLIASGAVVDGGVRVHDGGTLEVNAATINGSLFAVGADELRAQGSMFNGHVIIAETTGLVLFGGSDPCVQPNSPNTVNGELRITRNSANVQFAGNTVTGQVVIADNTGTVSIDTTTVNSSPDRGGGDHGDRGGEQRGDQGGGGGQGN